MTQWLKSVLLIDHIHVQKLFILSVQTPLRKTWMADNIVTDFNCHRVPAMSVKFSDVQFKFNSYSGRPVVHVDTIASSNTFNSQHNYNYENPNGWQRVNTRVCMSSIRYIPLISV